MKPQIKSLPTTDQELKKQIDAYMTRQTWMKNFINPKNKMYAGY